MDVPLSQDTSAWQVLQQSTAQGTVLQSAALGALPPARGPGATRPEPLAERGHRPHIADEKLEIRNQGRPSPGSPPAPSPCLPAHWR